MVGSELQGKGFSRQLNNQRQSAANEGNDERGLPGNSRSAGQITEDEVQDNTYKCKNRDDGRAAPHRPR